MSALMLLLAIVLTIAAYWVIVPTVFQTHNPYRPSKLTWGLWCVMDVLLIWNTYARGESLDFLVPLVFAGSLVMFVISIFRGNTDYTKYDVVAAILAATAICVWQLAKAPSVAYVMMLFGCGLSAVPTINQAWRQPEQIYFLPWVCFAISVPPISYAEYLKQNSWPSMWTHVVFFTVPVVVLMAKGFGVYRDHREELVDILGL